MPPSNEGPPYAVTYFPWQLAKLRAWGRLALRVGLSTDYAAALRALEDGLGTRPLEWGEAKFDNDRMNATICVKMTRTFVVYYAVHRERPVVLVQDVRLNPRSPLADAASEEGT
jgi:uncharacterized membrane protein YhfC